MPTLNYENAGALVDYDYLQGTITALYPADDTADVSGACGSLSRVPIFYHCAPDSAARANGALNGAASGFKVGDIVVVLKSSGQASSSLSDLDKIALQSADNSAAGPKCFIVGHYDGMVKCGTEQVRVYGYLPDGTLIFFIWDLDSNDYAADAFWADGYDFNPLAPLQRNYLTKSDFPFKAPIVGDVLRQWEYERTRIGVELFQPVDELPPYSATEYPEMTVHCANLSGNSSYDYHYEYRTGVSEHIVPDDYFSGDDTIDLIALACGDVDPVTHLLANRTLEVKQTDILNTNIITSYVGRFGGDWEKDAVFVRKYERFYGDWHSQTGLEGVEGGISWQSSTIEHTLNGKVNPLSSSSSWAFKTAQSGPLPSVHTPVVYGSKRPFSGGLAQATKNYFVQYWLGMTAYCIRNPSVWSGLQDFVPDYDVSSNIVAQAKKRVTPNSPVDTSRNSNFEAALKALIALLDSSWPEPWPESSTLESYQNKRIEIFGSIHTLAASLEYTLIDLLNTARGFEEAWNSDPGSVPPLLDDDILITASQDKVDFFLAGGIFQHEELSGALPDTPEILAIGPDSMSLQEVVDDWMLSPHHRDVIMNLSLTLAGAASGIYPSSFTEITMGPGIYQISGAYTTTPTQYIVPEDLRGHIRCFVVKFA